MLIQNIFSGLRATFVRRLPDAMQILAAGGLTVALAALPVQALAQYTVGAGKSVIITVPSPGIDGEVDGPRDDTWVGAAKPSLGTIVYGSTDGTATTGTYTARADASGVDSFSWGWRCGATSGNPQPCGNDSATVTVIPAKPTLTGVASISTNFGQAKARSLQVTPADAPLSAQTPPVHGSVSFSGGTVTYTPDAGFAGSDSFVLVATNAGGVSDPLTINVTVAPPPLPTVQGGSLNLAFNTPGAHNFAPSNSGSLEVTASPQHGSLAVASGVVTYTPDSNYIGADSFAARATNISGSSAAATVNVAVAPPPIPTLQAGSLNLAFNTAGTHNAAPTSGGVLAIDSAAVHGQVVISGGEAATYTPNTNYIGSDAFRLTATNLGGTSSPVTVNVVVAPPPIPTMTAGALTLAFNAPGSHELAPTSGGIVAIHEGPSHGTAELNGTRLDYTPDADFIGSDTIKVTATNLGGTSAPLTIPVTVAPPPIPVITGGAIAVSFNGNGSLDLAPTDRGVLAITEAPSHGDVAIVGGLVSYSADLDYIGADSFKVAATNLGGTSAPVSVTVTVAPPAAPSVQTAAVAVDYEVAKTFSLAVAGLYSTINVSQAAHGTVIVSGTSATYTPDPRYYGLDSFTYEAVGLGGSSGPATISVTVQRPAAPLVSAVSTSTPYQTAAKLTLIVDGLYDDLVIATPPTKGVAALVGTELDFTPQPGFFGDVVMAVVANGPGGASAPATVKISVVSPGGPSISAASGKTGFGQSVKIRLQASGVYDALLINERPANGSAVINGEEAEYTPAKGYAGLDTFTVVATGVGGASAPATVSVTVERDPTTPGQPTEVPHPTLTVAEGQWNSPLRLAVTAGLSGGPFLGVELVELPADGAAAVDGLDIVYSPVAGVARQVTLTYRVANAKGFSAPVSVTLSIGSPPPEAPAKEAVVAPGEMTQVDLTKGAEGGPFSNAMIVSVSPARAGKATINRGAQASMARTSSDHAAPAGASKSGSASAAMEQPTDAFVLEFVPEKTFNGDVSVRYSLANRFGGSTSGLVKIMVRNLPNPAQDAEVTALLTAQQQAARRFGAAQVSNVNRRLEAVRDGGVRRNQNGIGLSGASGLEQGPGEDLMRVRMKEELVADLVARRMAGVAEPAQLTPRGLSDADGRSAVSFWSNGVVELGEHRASGERGGFDFTTSGVSVGADMAIGDELIVGAGAGFGRDLSQIGDKGTKSVASARSAFVYGSYQPLAGFYIDGLAGVGVLDFRSTRFVTVTGDLASGRRAGDLRFAAVSAGYAHQGQRFQIVPYGRLEIVSAELSAFSEVGPEYYSLRYGAHGLDEVTGTLGVRGDYLVRTAFGELLPRFRVELHRNIRNSGTSTVSYADWSDSPLYTMAGGGVEDTQATFGVGLGLRLHSGWLFNLDVDSGVANGTSQSTAIRIGGSGAF